MDEERTSQPMGEDGSPGFQSDEQGAEPEEQREEPVAGGSEDEAVGAGEDASPAESRWDALTRKLEEVDGRFAALNEAASVNRKAKWLITALILAVLAGYGILIYATAKSFDMDGFLAELEWRTVKVLPDLSESLTKALTAVAPDYQKAFEQEAEKAMPILAERLPKERDLLVDNVAERVQKRLTTGLEGIAKRQEAKLVKHFPRLKDEKKLEIVSKHLQLAIQTATAELLYERLEKCVDAIIRVNETLDKFKPEGIREKDRLLKERLADVWDGFVGEAKVEPK